ncbi:hypothetical protein HK405_003122 [Cladochytrium tenue]|nr:hypothetical protein HK405_003122 [Cladochytrium tenue]
MTLRDLLRSAINNSLHHLFFVNEAGVPQHVITLTDILDFVVPPPPGAPRMGPASAGGGGGSVSGGVGGSGAVPAAAVQVLASMHALTIGAAATAPPRPRRQATLLTAAAAAAAVLLAIVAGPTPSAAQMGSMSSATAATSSFGRSATAGASASSSLDLTAATSTSSTGGGVSATATTATASGAATTATRTGLALLEPADGTLILGGWLDTSDTSAGHDTTTSFDERLGVKAGAFVLAQNIPVTVAPSPPYPNNTLLYANLTGLAEHTDARIFLTVYPNDGFSSVTTADFEDLANQIAQITKNTTRQVMLRYAPEMNGSWNVYGVQTMADTVRAVDANVALVWSPNYDQSGDSYTDYWPGDDYVDWVGLSLYWKGYKANYPWIANTDPPSDYVEQIITGSGSEGGTFDFYSYFAAGKGKPFVISETGAAFHLNYSSTSSTSGFTSIDAGPGRESIIMGYYDGFLFNETFLATYPLFKMVNMFEFLKMENEDGLYIYRDFRATEDTDTLAAFKAGVQSLASRGVLDAASTVAYTDSSTASGASAGATGTTSTTKTSGAGAAAVAGSAGSLAAAAALGAAGLLALLLL